MKVTLPQFSQHEAKILGPLTLKQTGYIGVAATISFILYYSLPFHIFLPIAIILGLSSVALSFLKINGMSLPTVLVSGFSFFTSSRVYLWQKTKLKTQRKIKIQIFEKSPTAKPLKTSKTSYFKKIKTKIN